MGNGRVLVADDEAFVGRMIADALRSAGIEPLLASNGLEAIRIAKTEKPDLILLDWMMPKLSGIEVCRDLKRDPQTSYIPVLMLTVRAQVSDEEEGRQAGATHYLTKPFSPRKLLMLVQELLNSIDAGPAARNESARCSESKTSAKLGRVSALHVG